MTATTASIEVRDYLAAVSRELADLPADERDDLLEDLDSHLHEVIAEGEGSLEQRLGPPEQYAAELRASAGLTSSDRSTAGVLHRAISSLSASTTWRQTAEHPWTRATLEFLPQLRPAWWIVRALLAVGLIAGLYHDRGYHDGAIFSGHSVVDLYRNSGLWPRGFASPYIGVALLVIAIPISISIGRRSYRGATRWLVGVGNLFAIAMVVAAFLAIGEGVESYSGVASVTPPGLVNNGNQVTNIYPYDAQGHALDHVRLFDQDGQPLFGVNDSPAPAIAINGVTEATAAPSANANEYPQPNTTTIYGPNGQPTTAVVPRPNIVAPPLPSPPATPSTLSPSTTPSTTPSAAPSANPSAATDPANASSQP